MGHPWSGKKKTPSEKQNSITICSGNIPETSGEATFFTLSAVFPQPHIHLCGQKAAKTTFYNIRTNSAESPSLQPSTMERWSVFPGAACPSSLLPWLHLCRAYTALPQPWQHPRTVVRNLVHAPYCVYKELESPWNAFTHKDDSDTWDNRVTCRSTHRSTCTNYKTQIKGDARGFSAQATDKTSFNNNPFRRQAG